MTSETTLKQWVGIRKGASQRATSELTVLHKESQKASSYAGLSKVYRPKNEDDEQYPPETKKVVLVAEQVLSEASEAEAGWWDVIATCEKGNQSTTADLVVDGVKLVSNAPVPLLLFLDKRFKDLRTFVEKMPTLDPNENWSKDPNGDLFRTDTTVTHKTKKVQRPIVLYEAQIQGDKALPAQTQLITEDLVVGWWDTVRTSGALPRPRQRELLKRLDKIIKAVKFAVEDANGIEVEESKIGEGILDWLFA